MQLKSEFRNYESLRREHDSQIIQIAMEAGKLNFILKPNKKFEHIYMLFFCNILHLLKNSEKINSIFIG